MSGGTEMAQREKIEYEIQYTKAADKFLKIHEDIRTQYEDAVRELLVGEHPEKVDVKRIGASITIISESVLATAVLSMP